jgi:hypothetical protein
MLDDRDGRAPLRTWTTIVGDDGGFQTAWHPAPRSLVEEELGAGSPLHVLTRSQQRLVVSASELYQVLGVSSHASTGQLRAAYYARCKEVHPDVNRGLATTDLMMRLNQAWEILRSDSLRRAYDWVEAQRVAAVA